MNTSSAVTLVGELKCSTTIRRFNASGHCRCLRVLRPRLVSLKHEQLIAQCNVPAGVSV